METTGGCLCGNIKYKILKMNTKAYHCHCQICQKASGGIFSTYVNLKSDQVSWLSNKPTFYKSSEYARRGFCDICGTSICYESIVSNKIDICVGSIDDKNEIQLMGHNRIESRLKNFSYEDDLPKYNCDDK